MDREEIRAVFEMLACSQGFYGRLLRDIDELDEDSKEVFWQDLEAQDFSDSVDVILYMES